MGLCCNLIGTKQLVYLPGNVESGTESNALFNYDYTEASFYWSLVIPKSQSKYESLEQIPDYLQFCLDSIKGWAPE